jgi:hypothetical protein
MFPKEMLSKADIQLSSKHIATISKSELWVISISGGLNNGLRCRSGSMNLSDGLEVGLYHEKRLIIRIG